MTTETEALRRAFEGYVNPDADIDLHWQAAGYYASRGLQTSWLDFQAGHAAAKAETDAAVAAERERAAQVCDRIADDYNERERFKYAELKTDAETGANECADAIRAGAKEPSDADQA